MKSFLGMQVFEKKRKNDWSETNGTNGKSTDSFKKPKLSFLAPSNHTNKTDRQALLRQKQELPIYSAKQRFLEEVIKSDTVVLVGETGSGKTTQIPQFIFEAKLNSPRKLFELMPGPQKPYENGSNKIATGNCIAITQPRRVAAISLSKRVSEEMSAAFHTSPDLVGYKVRFEDNTSYKTQIIFQTDGMLLREAMLDPLLSRYSWIILDEAHERTVNTDILFGIVKSAQKQRQQNWKARTEFHNGTEKKHETQCFTPLKVIVMSATLDAEKFSAYFRHAPILVVHGRQHPVNIHYASSTQDDWQGSIVSTIFQIHKEAPPKKDILVFLTGQDEIETMVQQIRQLSSQDEALTRNMGTQIKLIPMPLYASLQSVSQQRIFKPAVEGTRKVILATNLAETSITIPGISYVIDSCRVKAKVHVSSVGLDILQVVRTSQSQGWQRAGRAGRQSEGSCYRILTKNEFERLPKDTVPEIKRCSLTSVILQMTSIGIRNVSTFDFLEPPDPDAIQSGIRQLILLNALSPDSPEESKTLTNGLSKKPIDHVNLTELGKMMSAFPLDPKYTKAILNAKEYGCTEEVLTIVAMLANDQPVMLTPHNNRDEAIAARKKFVSSEGDLITSLNIFRAFKQAKNQTEFCNSHYLSHRQLAFTLDVRAQLLELCRTQGILVQSCANNTMLARKAISQAMFTNVARRTREGNYVTLDSHQEVKIHPSSVMFGHKPALVIFNQLIATQKVYIRDLSLADPEWLTEAQPDYFRRHRIIFQDNEKD